MSEWHSLRTLMRGTENTGADVILVDDMVDTANTLVRAAQVCKVRRRLSVSTQQKTVFCVYASSPLSTGLHM